MPFFKIEKIEQYNELINPFLEFTFLGPDGRREGLDLREIKVIMELAKNNGHASISDIIHTLSISPQSATRLIAKLIEKDLLSARDDPSNRRKKIVSLTDGAGELLRKAGIVH